VASYCGSNVLKPVHFNRAITKLERLDKTRSRGGGGGNLGFMPSVFERNSKTLLR
jgi:hypothetical protein